MCQNVYIMIHKKIYAKMRIFFQKPLDNYANMRIIVYRYAKVRINTISSRPG